MSDLRESKQTVGVVYLAEARRRLAKCHESIRHCLEQLDDARLWWRAHESMNSIANIVLHLCGNLRQWIVSGVGGAVDTRNRPQEFAERRPITKAELLEGFRSLITEADTTLAGFDPTRLLEVRRIQGFDGTVLSAIFDSLTHLQGHTQEIIHMTRLQLGNSYRFAWVPATPEQGAVTATETVAVRDATFEEMPAHPLKTAEPQVAVLPIQQPPVADARTAEPTDGPPQPAHLKDYLLDLEQEFQDEQEEGKV